MGINQSKSLAKSKRYMLSDQINITLQELAKNGSVE